LEAFCKRGKIMISTQLYDGAKGRTYKFFML